MNEDKATRYHRRRRRVSVVSVLLSGALLIGLLLTPGATALREVSFRLASALGVPGSLPIVVTGYVVMLGALLGLVALPLGVYRGVVLDRRYGRSSQDALGWLGENVKTVGVTLVIAVTAAVLMYPTLQLWPNRWWVISGLIFTLAVVSLNIWARSCCFR